MAKAKKNTKEAARKKAWRNCDGVNSSTGRIKKGFKMRRTGRAAARVACPIKAKAA